LKGRRDILGPLDHKWNDFKAKHARGGLGLAHFEDWLDVANVEHDCQPAQLRNKLTREFYSFADEFVGLDR
jgi:hypothetical protein